MRYLDNRLSEHNHRMAAKSTFLESLKPGTILTASWGYEQTNVEFYRVIERKGKNKVLIQELDHIESEHPPLAMSCDVMPGAPIKDAFTVSVSGPRIKINSSVSLTLWNGEKRRKSWYG